MKLVGKRSTSDARVKKRNYFPDNLIYIYIYIQNLKKFRLIKRHKFESFFLRINRKFFCYRVDWIKGKEAIIGDDSCSTLSETRIKRDWKGK